MEQTNGKAINTPEGAVKEYQCIGCVDGPYPDCYKTETGYGISCREHLAGTGASFTGRFFPSMPAGFNRLGHWDRMKPEIFEKFTDEIWLDKFNVPVWKHLDEHGNTLVRGLRPRLNEPFLMVILGDHLDKIECREISREEMKAMDY